MRPKGSVEREKGGAERTVGEKLSTECDEGRLSATWMLALRRVL